MILHSGVLQSVLLAKWQDESYSHLSRCSSLQGAWAADNCSQRNDDVL